MESAMKKLLLASALICALSMPAGVASAADQELSQDQSQTEEQEPVYGSQLMTEQERAEFRTRMRTARTPEEREQIRAEHHQLMQERAKERGLTLPDEPPARGGGMGPGGMGMRPGGQQ